MASNQIRLDAQRHANFLAEGRKDPITKEMLTAGMEIVICAHDNIAFISENWSGECPFCHGRETLETVPASTELRFGRSARQLRDIAESSSTVSPPQNSTTSAFRGVIYLFIVAATICIIYFAGIFVSNVVRGVGNWVSSTISEISTAISELGSNTVEETSTSTPEPNSNNPETTSTAGPGSTLQATDVTFLDPSVCSAIVRVEVNDTAKGDVLTIYCSNNVFYRLDPLAKGKYVIAPSGKFMVYATFDGDIYATRAGNKYLSKIGEFREFYMIKIQGVAELDISIDGDEPYYVIVVEKNMNERKKVLIPKEIYK